MSKQKRKPKPAYWSGGGRYKAAAAKLHKLIPDSGSVRDAEQNPALERFRRAQNCYYDLYNNGLWNRAAEFRAVFGFGATRIAKTGFTDAELIAKVDAAMDAIIADAAEEQGIKVRR